MTVGPEVRRPDVAGAGQGAPSPRLEIGAVLAGAAVGLAVLTAATVAAALFDAGDDDTPLLVVVLLVSAMLAGLGAAGWTAARRCSRAPLVHAAAAALAAVAVGEIAAVVRQAIGHDDIAWTPAVAWLLLAVAAGIGGGLSALRPRNRADSPG